MIDFIFNFKSNKGGKSDWVFIFHNSGCHCFFQFCKIIFERLTFRLTLCLFSFKFALTKPYYDQREKQQAGAGCTPSPSIPTPARAACSASTSATTTP